MMQYPGSQPRQQGNAMGDTFADGVECYVCGELFGDRVRLGIHIAECYNDAVRRGEGDRHPHPMELMKDEQHYTHYIRQKRKEKKRLSGVERVMSMSEAKRATEHQRQQHGGPTGQPAGGGFDDLRAALKNPQRQPAPTRAHPPQSPASPGQHGQRQSGSRDHHMQPTHPSSMHPDQVRQVRPESRDIPTQRSNSGQRGAASGGGPSTGVTSVMSRDTNVRRSGSNDAPPRRHSPGNRRDSPARGVLPTTGVREHRRRVSFDAGEDSVVASSPRSRPISSGGGVERSASPLPVEARYQQTPPSHYNDHYNETVQQPQQQHTQQGGQSNQPQQRHMNQYQQVPLAHQHSNHGGREVQLQQQRAQQQQAQQEQTTSDALLFRGEIAPDGKVVCDVCGKKFGPRGFVMHRKRCGKSAEDDFTYSREAQRGAELQTEPTAYGAPAPHAQDVYRQQQRMNYQGPSGGGMAQHQQGANEEQQFDAEGKLIAPWTQFMTTYPRPVIDEDPKSTKERNKSHCNQKQKIELKRMMQGYGMEEAYPPSGQGGGIKRF